MWRGRFVVAAVVCLYVGDVDARSTLAQVPVRTSLQHVDAVAAALARDAPATVQRAVDQMRLSSPTFRRQCLRLAHGQVEIFLRVVDPRLSGRSWRAQTRMVYRDGVVVTAHIVLPMWGDLVELLAHELEHVLEQLDGVDLARHVSTGVVWRSGDGSFETARATEVGRRVAEEVRSGVQLARVLR